MQNDFAELGYTKYDQAADQFNGCKMVVILTVYEGYGYIGDEDADLVIVKPSKNGNIFKFMSFTEYDIVLTPDLLTPMWYKILWKR